MATGRRKRSRPWNGAPMMSYSWIVRCAARWEARKPPGSFAPAQALLPSYLRSSHAHAHHCPDGSRALPEVIAPNAQLLQEWDDYLSSSRSPWKPCTRPWRAGCRTSQPQPARPHKTRGQEATRARNALDRKVPLIPCDPSAGGGRQTCCTKCCTCTLGLCSRTAKRHA